MTECAARPGAGGDPRGGCEIDADACWVPGAASAHQGREQCRDGRAAGEYSDAPRLDPRPQGVDLQKVPEAVGEVDDVAADIDRRLDEGGAALLERPGSIERDVAREKGRAQGSRI